MLNEVGKVRREGWIANDKKNRKRNAAGGGNQLVIY